MMMIPSTLLIHFLLIASIALFSAPTVRSDANPIRLPTLDHNNNNDDDDDACGEWSRRSPVSSCPVKCFRPDPVCGVDGVTYWCGCDDARCAGTKVTKKGFCEVGNNGAAAQALLLVHIVWLIVLGFSILFGLFWFQFSSPLSASFCISALAPCLNMRDRALRWVFPATVSFFLAFSFSVNI